VTAPNDAQQRLRASGFGVAGDGDLAGLGEGIAQRLKPLTETQRVLAHYAPTSGGLHLGQDLRMASRT